MKKHLPEFFGIALAILSLNLWYLSSIAIENKVLPTYYDYIFNGIISLTCVFAGSFLAFKLNKHIENQKRENKKYTEINNALFTFIRMLGSGLNL